MDDGRAAAGASIDATRAALASLSHDELAAAADLLADAWKRGALVLICGNGGSASTASHMAVDLSKQTRVPGLRPLRAVALTDSPGVLTAWANDAGFGRVFAEQVATLGSPGDVLVAISCTGNSPNVLEAAGAARGLGMHVLGLGGFDGGNLRDMSDVFIQVDSRDYGVVESVHLAIDHSLAAALSARAHARATAPSSRPVVIVDRDGVINRNVSDGVRSWDQFDFLPGSLEALADLKRRGYQVVVVTNQANIGRGLLTPAQLADIHRRMLEAVLAAGGEISGVHVCEHAPDERCVCRKPAPGLLLRAAEIHGFSLQDAFVVGDHPTDVAAARSAGAEPILVLSGRGRVDEVEQPHPLVAADLREAVEMITARSTLSARAELRGT